MNSSSSRDRRPALGSATLLVCTAVLGSNAHSQAQTLHLPWVFTDHMVVQRDRALPIRGAAAAGARVTVAFGESTATTTADESGTWRVDLPPQRTAIEGRDLVVRTRDREVRVRDVVIGDVWLCAGQSNMDFPLARAIGGRQAAATLRTSDRIRWCNRTPNVRGGARPLTARERAMIDPAKFYSGRWQRAEDGAIERFSAVAAFFGLELNRAIDVPIGLIDVSVGGSTTEGWISRARLADRPEFAPLLADYSASELSHPFIRSRVRTHLGNSIDPGKTPPPRHFFEPGFLSESAVQPLAPFGIRGVLWYQGESNAHLPAVADRLFRSLVDDWRTLWQQPALPFYFVQLPAMGRDSWPEFRAVQASWLDIPHTAMAVTIDTGHPTDVHPRDKRPIGERLARLVLAESYGVDLVASGPTVSTATREGDALVITFEHANGLGWSPGRDGQGFEVADADRRFHPAQAEIDGHRVSLTSSRISHPVEARYAWAPVPQWSLINGAGLPAAPFRTRAK